MTWVHHIGMASPRSHHEHFDTVSGGERAAPRPPARGSVRGAGGRPPYWSRCLHGCFCVACAPATAHVRTPGSRVFIFNIPPRPPSPAAHPLLVHAHSRSGLWRSARTSSRDAGAAHGPPPDATPCGRGADSAPSHRHAAARLSHNTTRPYRAPRQCPARSQTMYTWARVGTGAPHAAAPPQLPPTRTPPCGLGLTRSLPREAGGIPRLVLKALVRDRVHEPVAQLRLQARRREAVRQQPRAQLAQREVLLQEGLAVVDKVGDGGLGEGGRGVGGGGRRQTSPRSAFRSRRPTPSARSAPPRASASRAPPRRRAARALRLEGGLGSATPAPPTVPAPAPPAATCCSARSRASNSSSSSSCAASSACSRARFCFQKESDMACSIASSPPSAAMVTAVARCDLPVATPDAPAWKARRPETAAERTSISGAARVWICDVLGGRRPRGWSHRVLRLSP